jgi:hypothetical protein
MANEQILTNRPLPGARLNMSHPLTKGLVGCWLLNEGGGLRALDLSPYRYHGTLIGFDNPPKRAFNGLSFSLSSAKNSTPDWRAGDSQGTIGVWFKTNQNSNQTLFCSADEESATRFLLFEILVTTSLLQVRQSNDDTEDLVYGSTAVADSKWHSAFLTSTGTAWAIYLDGIAETLHQGTGSNSGDWFADTTLRDNFVVGQRIRNTTGGSFIGQIGLVAVYNRPLLPQEIQALYISPYSPLGTRMFI